MRETELTFAWCAECTDTVLFEVVDDDALACGGCGLAVWAAFALFPQALDGDAPARQVA